MNWHNVAKKLTKKWRRDGKLPCPTIGHYVNYMFDHISYIDGLGLYVSSRTENRHLTLENRLVLWQLLGFEGITPNSIVIELWPVLSDEEKTEFMTNILGSHD